MYFSNGVFEISPGKNEVSRSRYEVNIRSDAIGLGSCAKKLQVNAFT